MKQKNEINNTKKWQIILHIELKTHAHYSSVCNRFLDVSSSSESEKNSGDSLLSSEKLGSFIPFPFVWVDWSLNVFGSGKTSWKSSSSYKISSFAKDNNHVRNSSI